MGRPINKRSFGQTINQSIAIFANVGDGPDQFYIKSQSGTRSYRIGQIGDDSIAGTVRLVAKDEGDLLPGEGLIIAYQGDNFYPVIKLSQHRVSVLDGELIKSFSWKEENSGIVLLSDLGGDDEGGDDEGGDDEGGDDEGGEQP